MASLAQGLYELLVTRLLEEQLRDPQLQGIPNVDELRNAEAADRIALHVANVVETAIEDLPAEDRSVEGVKLARVLIDIIAQRAGNDHLFAVQLADPAAVLRSIRRRLPDGRPQEIPQPLIPLLDTTLLTNAPGEPRVGHQIQAEIASADRIDLVMAFIRRTGINPLMDALRRHTSDGKPLRVLTTVFTGSTEA